jgi:hypothetical protein
MSSNLINKCITIKDNNETPMYHETASMNILSKKGLLEAISKPNKMCQILVSIQYIVYSTCYKTRLL